MLMAAHLFGTFFAYTIYINLSSLGDGYLPESFVGFNSDNTSAFSTMLVHAIYAYLGIFLPGFMAPMLLGLVVAFVTWRTFRDVYRHINPKIFWICNLFPHYLVWSGSSSKEQIVIICGLIIINFVTKNTFLKKRLTFSNIIPVFISLSFIYIIRPNYFIIYLTIFLLSLHAGSLIKTINNKFTVGVYILIFSLSIIISSSFLSLNAKFMDEDIIFYMKYVEASFLSYEAGSNRINIQWVDLSDFLVNSLWGIPQGFIGPTLLEAIVKPMQIPVFIEGIIYLSVLVYLFINLFKMAQNSKKMRMHILIYLFVTMIIIFISYPFLIFNPGSALRYKQSLHPILIFYPLLILAYAKAHSLNGNPIKMTYKINIESFKK